MLERVRMAQTVLGQVLEMRSKNMSNNQIIQTLQRQGVSNTQIFDAMNQADAKMAVDGNNYPVNNAGSSSPSQSQPPMPSQNPFNPNTQNAQQNRVPPPISNTNMPFNQESSNVPVINDESMLKVEELVEAIIEEKWVEISRDVNKVVEWKNRVESKISDLESQIKLFRFKQGSSPKNK